MGAKPIEYETVEDKREVSIPKMNALTKVADCAECGSLMSRDFHKIMLGKNFPSLIKSIWRERLRFFGFAIGDGRHLCNECTITKSSKLDKIRKG